MVGDYRYPGLRHGRRHAGRRPHGPASGTYDALAPHTLPDGDGLDFTRELRGQPATRRAR